MAVAALIVWLLTALGGSTMLGLWLARGGMRAPVDAPPTRLPVPVLFGHLALAVIGLVLWIVYMVSDATALAWISLIVLLVIAALGFAMLARWLPAHRAAAHGGAAPAEPGPPEQAIPLPVVVVHGLFAVVTIILVLIAAIVS
ncbi:hypothetical protein [Actinomadura harenae]|uniref:DUF2269 family protein n=1 Tax=Actinomadura harenae TaxID=2483351 RepID=A0A3M2L6H3_9ACTN|nr:hypothetical protein [Actinomadura harenae]RMI33117.1 hypothetical protein EBO15_41660 [Actinomadura harenae]